MAEAQKSDIKISKNPLMREAVKDIFKQVKPRSGETPQLRYQRARDTLAHKLHVEKLKEEAVTDGLTGAWSRKALDRQLEDYRIRPRRGTESIPPRSTGVLLIDIDNFKKLNDTQGHTAGDEALKRLVLKLQGSVRASDMVARYGGEEFAILLPNLPDNNIATGHAERMRLAIEKNVGITVSIGVTMIKEDDNDITTIYKRADKNLYLAKSLGKNAVVDDTGKKVEHVQFSPEETIKSILYTT